MSPGIRALPKIAPTFRKSSKSDLKSGEKKLEKTNGLGYTSLLWEYLHGKKFYPIEGESKDAVVRC